MPVVHMDTGDRTWKNAPHAPLPGDQYYIGDCYERAPLSQDWELDTSELPYLTHIKSLSNVWKPLRFLADWMEVGTTPLSWQAMQSNKEERHERAQKTTVTLLEYPTNGSVTTEEITTAEQLRATIFPSSGRTRDDPPLRLFIVEDLSQQVIEMLGSRFDIDPRFFRNQIADYVWYNTRDPWAQAPSLTADIAHRDWFTIRNVRFRYYDTEASFHNARLESDRFNVLRRPDDDRNHWHYIDKPGAIVGMTRTRTSVWIGKDKASGIGMVGIVLLDPTVREGTPLWYGHSHWPPIPSMDSTEPLKAVSPQSLYEHIVDATTRYPWFPPVTNHESLDQQLLVKPTLYTIAAEWLVVIDYVRTRLSQIEWELERPTIFRSKGDVITDSLRRLHTWRRLVPMFREMVTEAIDQGIPTAKRITPPFDVPFHTSKRSFDDITPDFERVRTALTELENRVDRLTAVVTAEISIEDSRRGLEENHNLARLTWLATTFIPLSFVSGFFSMQDDISTMKYTYGWYFLVAVPLAAFTMLLAAAVGKGWFSKISKKNIFGVPTASNEKKNS